MHGSLILICPLQGSTPTFSPEDEAFADDMLRAMLDDADEFLADAAQPSQAGSAAPSFALHSQGGQAVNRQLPINASAAADPLQSNLRQVSCSCTPSVEHMQADLFPECGSGSTCSCCGKRHPAYPRACKLSLSLVETNSAV